jgi:hypothetical protein
MLQHFLGHSNARYKVIFVSTGKKSGAANGRSGTQRTLTKRLAPGASTIAIVVNPAVAVARVPYNVRTTNHSTDHSSDDRAGRPGNEHTRTRADGGAFKRSGLGRDGHGRERQHEHSSLEHGAHDKSPWLKLLK